MVRYILDNGKTMARDRQWEAHSPHANSFVYIIYFSYHELESYRACVFSAG